LNYILTIDVGTTSVKTIMFDMEGNIIEKISKEYSLDTSGENMVELPGKVYWNTCKISMCELLKKSGADSKEIGIIAVTTQGETFVTIDRDGNDTGDAIVWLDNRAAKESVLIEEKFGLNTFFKTTGLGEISPGWPAPKILWLKKNNPERFEKTVKFLLLQDYILYKLTGEYACELTNASSTGYLDINKGNWWQEMLEYLEIDKSNLGTPVKSGAVVGKLKKNIAAELGLSSETKVAAGAYDQAASAIGGGNVAAGVVTETTGTALVLVSTVDSLNYDIKGNITYFRHCISGKYMALVYSQTAGIILKWFKDQFCQLEEINSKDKDIYYILDEMASKVPAGSDDLLLSPHFAGKTSPNINSAAKGIFSGITLQHTKAHFVRTILESTGYMLRENAEFLQKASGSSVKSIYSIGGGAKSTLWCQIKSSILNKPVNVPECFESTSLGTAMLAYTALGVTSNLEEACSKFVTIKEVIRPEPGAVNTYNKLYKEFLKISN
jgi:sugar (pentulose or hexulose) kinase